MDIQIMVAFCLCDDMLKSLHHYEDSQCRMSDAAMITTAIIAILFLEANSLWQADSCLRKAIFQEC
jgi:hypothetical protein